jgi:hypothetical protein
MKLEELFVGSKLYTFTGGGKSPEVRDFACSCADVVVSVMPVSMYRNASWDPGHESCSESC